MSFQDVRWEKDRTQVFFSVYTTHLSVNIISLFYVFMLDLDLMLLGDFVYPTES